jgi:hypothetical protein
MEKIWTLAIALFLSITFLFWVLTNAHFKKEYGKKMWEKWTARLFYWQGAICTSTGITILLLLVLKWANVLTF